MIRTAATVALALVLALPGLALAKKHGTPAPAAAGSGGLSATPVSCPAADPVVWVNTSSKIYWASGTQYYGKTKRGGYACTSAAVAMGARAPKASPMGKHLGSATTAPLTKRQLRAKLAPPPVPAPTP